MALFLTLLPIYIFGNLHCIGMCGPLVMLLGQHRYRYSYFLGRACAFSLAGALAGGLGAVLNGLLRAYHLAAGASLLFGAVILVASVCQLMQRPYPGYRRMAQHFNKLSVFFAQLLGRDQAWPIFLFGLGTVLLPCGQTLIVFSACALEGDPWIGWVNGLAFALLTSPSLFLAMHATRWLCRFKGYYNLGIGLCGAAVGILALARGFAELNWISHWILNPDAEACYHIVLY